MKTAESKRKEELSLAPGAYVPSLFFYPSREHPIRGEGDCVSTTMVSGMKTGRHWSVQTIAASILMTRSSGVPRLQSPPTSALSSAVKLSHRVFVFAAFLSVARMST